MGRLIKYNDNSISEITATGLASGSMVLIKEQTASASASISFVDGTDGVVLDSTYNTYLFKFINIHPATDSVNFTFNLSTDSGSSYNVTKTTTLFHAEQAESDSDATLTYRTGEDLAQSSAYQYLGYQGADNDQVVCGELKLFSPSNTTFVKHFIAKISNQHPSEYARNIYMAGYGNTTSAVNAIDFKFSSGNIDAGTIKLYGVRES
jgi:hypothetical protein